MAIYISGSTFKDASYDKVLFHLDDTFLIWF